MEAFRAGQPGPVLAAVGPADASEDFESQLGSTILLAEEAAALGADGLMVYPMSSLHDEGSRRSRTLRLHREVAEATELPVIGFYLYERAGGVEYSPALLTELCSLPGTVGVKLALLNDAIICQDAISAIRAAGGMAISGEDRMLGPSLMWGAESVLVGLGAAAAEVTTRVVRSWFAGDMATFIAESARLDEFASVIFREPMDGYVQRMLWLAAEQGLVPEEYARDYHGQQIHPDERRDVERAFARAVGDALDPQPVNDGRSPRRAGIDLADPLGEA
jgi:4-hydroxy-tetrahydrodipicolinate synthase